MRKIEFRGQRHANGEWAYGSYVQNEYLRDWIYKAGYPPVKVEVDPDTVGRATSWTDMNGKRLYEGDQVRCYHFTDIRHKDQYLYHTIEWDDEKGLFKFVSCSSNESDLKNGTLMGWVYMKNSQEIEVIGNIYGKKQNLESETV